MGGRPIEALLVSGSGPRPRSGQQRTANLGGGSRPLLNLESTSRKSDLVSALKHQGCTRAAAEQATAKAMSHQDEALEVALRRAIGYAREAA